MSDFVLITSQRSDRLVEHRPGPSDYRETNAYHSPDVNAEQLEAAGHLLADGASPPMTFEVLPLQPAKWGSA